jgi:hypothetical protein
MPTYSHCNKTNTNLEAHNAVSGKCNASSAARLSHSCIQNNWLECNFHVFGPLKNALKGQMFASDDNVQDAVAQ